MFLSLIKESFKDWSQDPGVVPVPTYQDPDRPEQDRVWSRVVFLLLRPLSPSERRLVLDENERPWGVPSLSPVSIVRVKRWSVWLRVSPVYWTESGVFTVCYSGLEPLPV